MKTLLPSLALLLAPALAASIPIAALPSSAFQIPLPEPRPEDAGSVANSDIPAVVPDGTMGPLLPGQCWASQCSQDAAQADAAKAGAAGFNFAEAAAKEAAKEAKAGAKDPFLPDGMRWVPGCANQGPPCRYEPDPSKVGPGDIVVADANGEKIVGANGTRAAEEARRREEERQRQADPLGQYDPSGLGGMRRPPVAPDRVVPNSGGLTVGQLLGASPLFGFVDPGAGTGPSSQKAPNVVQGAYGDVVQVEGVSYESALQSQGGIKQLAQDTEEPISFLKEVAGKGADGVSAGNKSADDGTQGCQQGQGGDLTPCLGIRRQ